MRQTNAQQPSSESKASAPGSVSVLHLRGTVSAIDIAAKTITFTEDAASQPRKAYLGETRTLIRVAPGSKDLTSASRVQIEDLAPGDRIDLRALPSEDGTTLNVRSLILMSGRDIKQVHSTEEAEWRRALSGVVTSVDSAASTLTVSVKRPTGPGQMSIDASHAEWLRYSPDNPTSPVASNLHEVQQGDQVRIIADNSQDARVVAKKIYSGTFRSLAATISKVNAEERVLTVKDLQTKQTVDVRLNDSTKLRRMPPLMANMMARRLNPQANQSTTTSEADGRPKFGPSDANPPSSPSATRPAGQGRGNGDLAQMLDRLPLVNINGLKPGDAIIVSGSPGASGGYALLATAVIAGVEPIFASATPRQVQALGNWSSGLDAAVGEAGGSPQ